MSILKYALPAAALAAMFIPGVGPFASLLGSGAAGAGAGAGSAMAGLTAGASGAGAGIGTGLASAGATAAGHAGLGATLLGGLKTIAPMALQAGIGGLLGGPQGAMQLPLMGMNAQRQNPGMSPMQSLMTPILGGLAGRIAGGPGGGLAGMGMGGLLDPWTGPLAHRPTSKPELGQPNPQPQETYTSQMSPLGFSPSLFHNPSLMIPLLKGLRG